MSDKRVVPTGTVRRLFEEFRAGRAAADPTGVEILRAFEELDEAWGNGTSLGIADAKFSETPLGKLVARRDGFGSRTAGLWVQLQGLAHCHLREDHSAPWTSVEYRMNRLEEIAKKVSRRQPGWRAEEVDVLWRAFDALEQLDTRHHIRWLLRLPLAATEQLDVTDRKPFEKYLRQALRALDRIESWQGQSADHERTEALLDSIGAAQPLVEVADLLPRPHPKFDIGLREVLHRELAAELTAPGVPACVRHWKIYSFREESKRYKQSWLDRARQLRTAAPGADEALRQVLSRAIAHDTGFLEGEQPEWTSLDSTTWMYLDDMLLAGMVRMLELVDADWADTLLVDVVTAGLVSVDGVPTHPRGWELAREAADVLARRHDTSVPQTDQVARVLGDLGVLATAGSMGAATESWANTALTKGIVTLLAGWPGDVGVLHLTRIQAKTRHKGILNTLTKALDTAAARAGLTPDQLVERTVPTFGFAADGSREEQVGDFTAVISLDAAGAATLVFRGADGKPRASVPKAVKDDHADQLKQLRATVKEIKQAVPAERARLEAALSDGRSWPVDQWRRYYLDHPFTGIFARALIWECSCDGGATWQAGTPAREGEGEGWSLASIDGTPVRCDTEATVRLWHPIRALLKEVSAWRERLYERQLRQPFKQAFREIYLLTPAEEETGGYSNRFAAHILKYFQARALLVGRGWSGMRLGPWHEDLESDCATKELTDTADGTRWRARFHADLVESGEHRSDGDQQRYCSTDQVRFERHDGGGWVTERVADVPPLLLSETLRDVDLAVGVASVAADPTWSDRGVERYRDYWYDAGFGALGESAQMRREALARLLPRLKIADRVELTDRFLRVHGSLRTYRVHLGSGNILMEPDDSYLCIVAAGRSPVAGRLFLPFEDDRLSLILSKALLLADDTEITDESILRQIKRHG